MQAVKTSLPTLYRCTACGWTAPEDELLPFRCGRRGDGADHVLTRSWIPSLLPPHGNPWLEEALRQDDPHPFVRYRHAFHAWHFARARGMDDREWIDRVRDLDRRVAEVDGSGFRVTPLHYHESWPSASSSPSPLWIKDESGGVGGSHKARHLMGIAIWLEMLDALRLSPQQMRRAPLAIASCGNAALAAATIAAAMGRRLRVFVPEDAEPEVVRRIRRREAEIHRCPRMEGEVGDPSLKAFHREVEDGAIPFGCQGPDNGMTLEGGFTLGYEMVQALREVEGDRLPPRHLVVQVGGGALATSVFLSWMEALRFDPTAAGAELGRAGSTAAGVDSGGAGPTSQPGREGPGRTAFTLPRLHTVQTRGGWPLRRAWEHFVQRIEERQGRSFGDERRAAEEMALPEARAMVLEELTRAARHRAEFMQPWPTTPHSVATGILDDETYDWWALLRAMVLTGGIPVVADEDTLIEAHEQARQQTSIAVSATGSAGLAGWMVLQREGWVEATDSAALLFTGREWEGEPA